VNDAARILFENMHSDIASWSRHTASQVRRAVPTEGWSPEQHQALEAALREGMKSLAWSFFGTFDNVGCALPDGVLGYRITGIPSAEKDGDIQELAPVDIREDDTDYADMWQEFLASEKEQRHT